MEICELEFGENFVEVRCGCTSKKYGDTTGKLKIFESGDLEIECDCGCREGKLTPSEFETHAIGEGVPKRWKQKIWVQVKGKKVPIKNTALLKYYNKAEEASGSIRGARARRVHRDEFKYCIKCSKARRFRLQTKEECRVYHDAERNANWKCSDFPDGRMSCDDEEERASRRLLRGCLVKPLCKGCLQCSCIGCETCRFSDCNCQLCTDFVKNAEK